jgi:ornithine cyclodeaminase/alanine dehydrogenase-like protein (mu-crystallin family)
MQFFDADAVHFLLDYPGLIEAMRQAHRGPAPDASHMMVRDEPGGGGNKFVVQVGWQRDTVIAVKLVGVFPENPGLSPPQPSVQGLVAVFDAGSGSPLFVADGAAMTFRKTAADSALGASLLARSDAKVLVIVGAGGLAPHMLAAHRAARPSLERVLVWNRTPGRAEALASVHAGRDFSIAAVSDLDAAVTQADIVSCVTMSKAPLVRGRLLKPGAHLDLVGAYLPDMREADDEAMARGKLFVDTRSGMQDAGDLRQPADRGIIRWEDISADLYELCAGRHPGRGNDQEITVYKNVGGGHLDLFTARHLKSVAELRSS